MGKYTIAKELGVKCVSQRNIQDSDAVMFDIDETLIHVDGSPIDEMISLFKLCKVLGYNTIIIITIFNINGQSIIVINRVDKFK